MPINTALLKSATKFEHWMANECLPLWLRSGLDKVAGGHYEQLNQQGLPDRSANIRVRVQARQAFSYAYAYNQGWLPEGDRISLGLMQFIAQHTRHPERAQGFTHLMDPEFNIIDDKQDLYDHAFIFLAYASVYKATGQGVFLQQATSLLKYWDAQFGSLAGGWVEGDYHALHRRQNPHMHLFEAFMALYEASNNPQWLARASEIFALFQTRFFDAQRGIIIEYFDNHWHPYCGDQGTQVEPGHMMEWVWLLRWYETLSGRDVSHYTQALYSQAMTIGFSANSPLMDDFVYIDDSANIRQRAHTKRCWPMTESIKAHIAEAKAGNRHAEQLASDTIELLFRYFLTSDVKGGYCDQRGGNDQIINANISASTLYHLTIACGEAARYCEDKK